MSQATRALKHAFETGALAERRAFFLRAEEPPFAGIQCEQSLRPEFLKLKGATARLTEGSWPLGLVLMTKHKEENFANIARGWGFTPVRGSGLNCDGAACTARGSMASSSGSARVAPRPRNTVRRGRGWRTVPSDIAEVGRIEVLRTGESGVGESILEKAGRNQVHW